MSKTLLRIGIAGCGLAARIHLERLLPLEGVVVVGLADPDLNAATALAAKVPVEPGTPSVPAFRDHRELLRQTSPDALAIFTPHISHYRPAMDALQAGCHLFIEKPLSTNLQEASDIVNLARGRGSKVGVGHQYRLRPSLVAARERIASGAIGPLRLVTATLAQPWLASHGGEENTWRFDPKVSGGGVLADAGDHLIDALLWTTGQVVVEAAALQSRMDSGLDLVTAVALRMADGTPATLAVSGVSSGPLFELNYFGELGCLRASENALEEVSSDGVRRSLALPDSSESIDANFVSALTVGTPLCCPADQALDTVRLIEAIARSTATAQVVRLT